MKTYKIVNETACIMVEENGKFVDAYFINGYTFSSFSKKQVVALERVLNSNFKELQEIWQLDDHTLYVTMIDTADKQVTAQITNDGFVKKYLTIDLLDLTDEPDFHIVLDFAEKRGIKGILV